VLTVIEQWQSAIWCVTIKLEFLCFSVWHPPVVHSVTTVCCIFPVNLDVHWRWPVVLFLSVYQIVKHNMHGRIEKNTMELNSCRITHQVSRPFLWSIGITVNQPKANETKACLRWLFCTLLSVVWTQGMSRWQEAYSLPCSANLQPSRDFVAPAQSY